MKRTLCIIGGLGLIAAGVYVWLSPDTITSWPTTVNRHIEAGAEG